jgi:hypothetical protein
VDPLPKLFASQATTGTARRAIVASRGSMRSIITKDPITTRIEENECMTAGPASIRTAERSFVARDIRSPVLCF